MFVVLDDRPSVAGGCVACFEREGIAAVAVEPAEFTEWFELISDADVAVVEGFLLGTVVEPPADFGADTVALPGTAHRFDRSESALRDARSFLAGL